MKTVLTLFALRLTGRPAPRWTTGIGQHVSVLVNRSKRFVLGAGVLAVAQLGALASDPVGIYAFVDKVVVEPSDTAPERIQIWGGFALAEGFGYTYATAQRGYMYFKLDPDKEEICRKEWADLKTVAGTGQMVAFGSRHKPKGGIRKAETKPANPDVYPTGFGLTKVRPRDYKPINELLALHQSKPKKETAPAKAGD